MNIVETPHEQVLVLLRSDEILALWRCLNRVRDSMSAEQFLEQIEIGNSQAIRMAKALSDALQAARRNLPD